MSEKSFKKMTKEELDNLVSFRFGRTFCQVTQDPERIAIRPALLSRAGIKSFFAFAFGGRLFFGIMLGIALYNLVLDTFGIREISNFDQLFYLLITLITGTALYLLGKLRGIVFWVRESTLLLGENIEGLNKEIQS